MRTICIPKNYFLSKLTKNFNKGTKCLKSRISEYNTTKIIDYDAGVKYIYPIVFTYQKHTNYVCINVIHVDKTCGCTQKHAGIRMRVRKYRGMRGPELGTSGSEGRNAKAEAHRQTQRRSSDSKAWGNRRGPPVSPETISPQHHRRQGSQSPRTGTRKRRAPEKEVTMQSCSPACALDSGIGATKPREPSFSRSFSFSYSRFSGKWRKTVVGKSLTSHQNKRKSASNGVLTGGNPACTGMYAVSFSGQYWASLAGTGFWDSLSREVEAYMSKTGYFATSNSNQRTQW